MDHSKILVKMAGHSLELEQLPHGRIGEAIRCLTCENDECSKVARFNKYYEVKVDPSSPKGWHVVESR